MGGAHLDKHYKVMTQKAHVYVVWEEEEVGKTLQQQEGVVRNSTVDTLHADVHTCMASLHVLYQLACTMTECHLLTFK